MSRKGQVSFTLTISKGMEDCNSYVNLSSGEILKNCLSCIKACSMVYCDGLHSNSFIPQGSLVKTVHVVY